MTPNDTDTDNTLTLLRAENDLLRATVDLDRGESMSGGGTLQAMAALKKRDGISVP